MVVFTRENSPEQEGGLWANAMAERVRVRRVVAAGTTAWGGVLPGRRRSGTEVPVGKWQAPRLRLFLIFAIS